jgi:hypothetical protein
VRAFLVYICAAAGLSQQVSVPPGQPPQVLRTSSDPEALERAASALARSKDDRDLELLARLLRDDSFLKRLDKPGNPKAYHLGRVMAVLAEHPTERTAHLCLMLADDSIFLAEDARQIYLLETLAAVKPMSEPAAAVFRRTNEEGYFASNASLLAANGGPRALGLFESMMLQRNVPVERRIDCLHAAVVPRRTELPILRTCGRILSHTTERALAAGVIESVFEYKPEWFGLAVNSPTPPAWQSARPETLRFAFTLADQALGRREIDPKLRKKVAKTKEDIAQLLLAPGK